MGGTGIVENPQCFNRSLCIDTAYSILGNLIDFDFDSKVDTPKTITDRGKNFIIYQSSNLISNKSSSQTYGSWGISNSG